MTSSEWEALAYVFAVLAVFATVGLAASLWRWGRLARERRNAVVDRESALWRSLAEGLNRLPYLDPWDDEAHLVDAAWVAVRDASVGRDNG